MISSRILFVYILSILMFSHPFEGMIHYSYYLQYLYMYISTYDVLYFKLSYYSLPLLKRVRVRVVDLVRLELSTRLIFHSYEEG